MKRDPIHQPKVGDSFTLVGRQYDTTRTVVGLQGMDVEYRVSYSNSKMPKATGIAKGIYRQTLLGFSSWASRADHVKPVEDHPDSLLQRIFGNGQPPPTEGLIKKGSVNRRPTIKPPPPPKPQGRNLKPGGAS